MLPVETKSHQSLAKGAGSVVEARNLTRRFGTVVALDAVSLDIQEGEFFSLLGPSGCGKTTLLRLIAGLDFSDSGSLKIVQRDATGWPAYQRPVNTVFQSYALFPHLAVRDNVAFGLRMKKISVSEISKRVEHVLKTVQIAELAGRMPDQISGGQRQRVALARAIVNEPKILLLDEPLGALDLKLRKQLQVELHQLQRRLGITFIYVTHDQDEALTMSDRIAVLNHGKIEQLGTPIQLYERPRNRFVAQFVGSCNLIDGKIVNSYAGAIVVETAVGRLVVSDNMREKVAPLDGAIVLAIRPEKTVLTKITNADLPNQFAAKVENVIYSGAETHYLLRVGNLEVRNCVFNSARSEQFTLGETVGIHFPPEALITLDE